MAHDVGALARNVQVISALPAANVPGYRRVYNPFASYAVLGQILVATDPTGRLFQQADGAPLTYHNRAFGTHTPFTRGAG